MNQQHQELIEAARSGNQDAVRSLIHQVHGVPIDVFEAALDGELNWERIDIIDYLYELWTACNTRDPDREFLRVLGDFFKKNPNLDSGLMYLKFDWAVMTGNLELVKQLYNNGCRGSTGAGTYAVVFDKMEALEYMADKFGLLTIGFAMKVAASLGHITALKIIYDRLIPEMIEYGLENAAYRGHIDVIKLLLDHPSVKDKRFKFERLMYVAAMDKRYDIVRVLYKRWVRGVNPPSAKDVRDGVVPSMVELDDLGSESISLIDWAAGRGFLEFVKDLAQEKDFETYGPPTYRGINKAAINGYTDVVEFLRSIQ